ncbi:enolase [Companilactobacillus paralimentarius DSM 13238 = JCM 10415]|uniref:Enolase n=1 Tax=Companilactobacillus paralimentarius DSM 13238 = JCM 10415 TaxID=1122151 RepID=A0A0R1PHX7_9LACO|nr:phosphopyruvate hydratase [Companilactobacillus paralimentarius]KAE9562416.1 enolase [Companilactobacillus paralimentarius]KRL31817.1 enolase [Companilactobacillus paralimentarius DSM 13238 = JCM 10415]QFR68854.1 phosphopyruvate hydratase [Companilactobacillus paralimentarius]
MTKVTIENVKAREIFDSRGNPTVEADVILSNGILGRASVPSGKSTGDNEAVELRDGGDRLDGKGVLKAVNNVNTLINDKLKGADPFNQAQIDQMMIDLDGTPNKAKLGANAILGVSIATVRAAANAEGIPVYRYLGGVDLELPQTFHNVINGGEHADNGIDMQEFLITPIKRTTFRDGFEKIVNVYHQLKKNLEKEGYQTGLGDEGGFAPDLPSSEAAIDELNRAIKDAGYVPGEEIGIAFDAAASSFAQDDGSYLFEGKKRSAEEMGTYYEGLLDKYPAIVSMEDPFGENDWDNFAKFTQKNGNRVQIVTDDNVCTNPALFRKAIKKGMANSFLIKLNQIGTVSETMEAIRVARKNGYTTMMSHRSGETEDSFLADFTVAMHAEQLKSGAPARGERLAKYNQLLRIEEELGKESNLAHFPNDVDFD